MNTLNLRTERTTLELVVLSDIEVVHELHSLAETDAYNTLGIPKDIAETKKVLNALVLDNQASEIKTYTFKILRNIDHQFMGLFGLKLSGSKYNRAEVWYKIHVDYWNKGYATEVLRAVLNFGFDELNLHRIQAGCAVANIGSIKVLEKVGMLREGRGRQVLPLTSGWSDNYEYAILKTDPRA